MEGAAAAGAIWGSWFDALPVEIQANIFGVLDAPDLGRCSLVCSAWHRLCSDELLWKLLFARDFGDEEGGEDLPPTKDRSWRKLYEECSSTVGTLHVTMNRGSVESSCSWRPENVYAEVQVESTRRNQVPLRCQKTKGKGDSLYPVYERTFVFPRVDLRRDLLRIRQPDYASWRTYGYREFQGEELLQLCGFREEKAGGRGVRVRRWKKEARREEFELCAKEDWYIQRNTLDVTFFFVSGGGGRRKNAEEKENEQTNNGGRRRNRRRGHSSK
ncbi:F-box protein 10 [Balamuthia mandrillaris]